MLCNIVHHVVSLLLTVHDNSMSFFVTESLILLLALQQKSKATLFYCPPLVNDCIDFTTDRR